MRQEGKLMAFQQYLCLKILHADVKYTCDEIF